MRIAILSDIHGNRTAFEAVLADLQQTSPDLILHGGDLADAGASPVEIVDRVRDLGWKGVVGNTDEMLFRPESLEEFAGQSSAPPSLWTAIPPPRAFALALESNPESSCRGLITSPPRFSADAYRGCRSHQPFERQRRNAALGSPRGVERSQSADRRLRAYSSPLHSERSKPTSSRMACRQHLER